MIPRKLSIRISIVVFSGTAIVLFAVSVFAFLFTRAALQQFIMDSQLEIARQSINKIDRLLYERHADVEAIAGETSIERFLADPVLQQEAALGKVIARRITDLTIVTGPWDLLLVVDKEGNIIMASEGGQVGTSVKAMPQSAEAHQTAMQKGFYYSDLTVPEGKARSTVIFASAVRDTKAARRSVIGVVIGYFSWPAVLQVLEDAPGAAALFNEGGMIIGRNEQFRRINPYTQRITDPELLEKLKEKHSASSIFSSVESVAGKDILASLGIQTGYLSYEGSGWGLMLEQPASVAFAPATKSALKLVLLLMPIIFLTSVPVLVMVLRWIGRPIEALTLTTREIAAGDLTKKVPVTSGDELGELATSFNIMTEKLRRSQGSLEEKVKERTAEVLRVNASLKQEIDDRKRLEGVVLQSEKMAAVGQLAGGVAHEINNPLGVILGFAQGVVQRLKPGDALEMPLKSIEREAIRCKQLVQDLLTFSRTGKTDKENIDANEAIEGSLSLVLAQSRVKSVEFLKEFSPDIPKILVNRSQLQQVVINLCNNAIDAMEGGGKLVLRTRKAQLEQKPAVEIQVEDTGRGIPKEIQPKIFEPFFTTKEVGKGTGLGLSLVYEIIQKHGGRILVESDAGKGTLFRIFLPCVSAGVSTK